jgi:hypothetical protein
VDEAQDGKRARRALISALRQLLVSAHQCYYTRVASKIGSNR